MQLMRSVTICALGEHLLYLRGKITSTIDNFWILTTNLKLVLILPTKLTFFFQVIQSFYYNRLLKKQCVEFIYFGPKTFCHSTRIYISSFKTWAKILSRNFCKILHVPSTIDNGGFAFRINCKIVTLSKFLAIKIAKCKHSLDDLVSNITF